MVKKVVRNRGYAVSASKKCVVVWQVAFVVYALRIVNGIENYTGSYVY